MMPGKTEHVARRTPRALCRTPPVRTAIAAKTAARMVPASQMIAAASSTGEDSNVIRLAKVPNEPEANAKTQKRAPFEGVLRAAGRSPVDTAFVAAGEGSP